VAARYGKRGVDSYAPLEAHLTNTHEDLAIAQGAEGADDEQIGHNPAKPTSSSGLGGSR